MIRANAALTRQVQDFFHTHLLDIYRWDEVQFAPPERNAAPVSEINARGRRRRGERPEGRFRAHIQVEFGIWKLTVDAPGDDHPTGWIVLEAGDIVEGPLDSATWRRMAAHIKEKHQEIFDAA